MSCYYQHLGLSAFLLLPIACGSPPVPTDSGAAASAAAPAAIFGPVIAEIQDSVRVPILLPAKLPAVLQDSEVNMARALESSDGYGIELRDSSIEGNAGSAAYFAGSPRISDFSHDPALRRLLLANGSTAIFSPVSCGGSCSGPNLWWVQDSTQYSIQIRLPSDTREPEQERVMLEAANSMVPARRSKASGR